MTRGVDSSEKTLHTTSGNECKFSWDIKARRNNMTDNNQFLQKEVSYTETSTISLPDLAKTKFQPNVTISFSQISVQVLFIKTTYSREPWYIGVHREQRTVHAFVDSTTDNIKIMRHV